MDSICRRGKEVRERKEGSSREHLRRFFAEKAYRGGRASWGILMRGKNKSCRWLVFIQKGPRKKSIVRAKERKVQDAQFCGGTDQRNRK